MMTFPPDRLYYQIRAYCKQHSGSLLMQSGTECSGLINALRNERLFILVAQSQNLESKVRASLLFELIITHLNDYFMFYLNNSVYIYFLVMISNKRKLPYLESCSLVLPSR